MIPKKPQCDTEKQGDLFRIELIDLVDKRRPLVILAEKIPWNDFDDAFTPLYCPDNGRPGIPTRLMVGLHYLKHTYDLSDEATVKRWVENQDGLNWGNISGYVVHEALQVLPLLMRFFLVFFVSPQRAGVR